MRVHTLLTIAVTAVSFLSADARAANPVPAESKTAEPKQKESDAMQGAWTIESFTLEGNPIDPEQLKNWRRIVERNHVVWKNGDETMIELDIKFDASQTPHTLDSTIATGESKGQVLLAIYELKDGQLKVCFAKPNAARPKKFSSEPGSGQSLYVAKRVKK